MAANLPLFAINFVLASAGGLWALRYPETHELYVLEREPVRTARALEQSRQPRALASRGRSAARGLASERMDTDPGWRLLAAGEILHVTPTLEASHRRILEHPPRGYLPSTISAQEHRPHRHTPRTCPTPRKAMPPAGFEPATCGLEVRCSIQLSYGGGLVRRTAGIEAHGKPGP